MQGPHDANRLVQECNMTRSGFFARKKKAQQPPIDKKLESEKEEEARPLLAEKIEQESHIFDSLSFGTLDEYAQRTIYAYLRVQARPQFHNETLFRSRQSLARALTLRETWLETLNPASIKFLNDTQKNHLAQELYFAFYIFSAQYQLDVTESRAQCLPERGEQIKKCAKLLAKLRRSLGKETLKQTNHEVELERSVDDSEKPLKYLGLTLVAPVLVELTESFISTGQIRDKMNEINGRRLYWVWGRTLLTSVLEALSLDFFFKVQADENLEIQGTYMGYLSWILYYARAGMRWGLLLKHTLKGPWMSEAEREMDITAWERFSTQWDQRKFYLINDTIWATGNLACFYWLIGNGMFGWWGNVLTAGLLLMDVSVAWWSYNESETAHKADMLKYRNEINALEEKIAILEHGNDEEIRAILRRRDVVATLEGGAQVIEYDLNSIAKTQQISVLREQLSTLTQAQAKCALDWTLKRKGLNYDFAYAVGLLAAFIVLCSFLVFPGVFVPLTTMIIGITGAALCFVLNGIYAGFLNSLDVEKSTQAKSMAISAKNDYINLFLNSDEPRERKRLYLEIQRLEATSEYQRKMVVFQEMALVHSVIVDAIIPAGMFAALVFLPLGFAFAALAAGLLVAYVAYKIIETYKPKQEKLPKFDNDKFIQFEAEIIAEAAENKIPPPKAAPAPRFLDKRKPGKGNDSLGPSIEDPLDPLLN
jgi:hypothetical protein